MNVFKSSALSVMLSSALFTLSAAHAAPKEQAFAHLYQPVASVGKTQAQVIFYREADGREGGANVYVDGEFHSALLANGYTTFCVAPGNHSLGAFINDAPSYQGKNTQPWRSDLKGGQTYFLKVGDVVTGLPNAVSRAEAEPLLKGMRKQNHTLSRASAVQACQYTEKQYKDYTLSSDVLFPFGKSNRGNLTRDGERAITELVQQIRSENSTLRNVMVVGHTDQIGSAAANQALGQRRAATVRMMMIEAGIPARDITASSAGMNEPLVGVCSGSKAEQIACYAPNRRVTIRVDGSSASE